VATWGNLVNRALTIAHRNFGEIPTPAELQPADEAVLTVVNEGFDAAGDLIERASFKAALGDVMTTRAKAVNEYFSSQEPWQLVKTDEARAATVLYVAMQCIDNLKTLLTPFLPFSSQVVHELLGNEGAIAAPLEFREIEED